MKQLRSFLAEVLLLSIPQGGERALISQAMSDYAIGLDMTGVLSQRLSPQYMFEHMGGLDGRFEDDLTTLQDTEAYEVEFSDEEALFRCGP